MEQSPKFYLSVSNLGAPEYDDILNSDLPKEEKVKQIKMRGQQYEDEINRGAMLDNIRMGLGTAMSAASFLPVFNIPYVGTGIGGAMYDAGQAIVEGDKLNDITKRAGRGFVIGETVGAVPYVGKAVTKTKAGQAVLNSAPVQAVGDALNKAGEKFAQSNVYDALMTDIKAFNPNKQTVYHGSPYDFEKFSNEAIGTGEGAQAHGYGYYAALNKDVAEGYRNKLSTTTVEENLIKQYGKERVINNLEKDLTDSLQELQALQKAKIEQAKVKDFGRRKPIDYDNSIKLVKEEINNLQNRIYNINNPKISGQLYKLSIPKDDVMLREGATFVQQPKVVQQALNELYPNYIPNDTPMSGLFMRELLANQGINRTKDEIRKAISDKLYSKGVKGISYNGGIDGEARVIFNPDDIDIVRKYYNQPNLYEQLTEKQNTGALVDALLNR